MKKWTIVILSIFLTVACSQGERERLFEMVYPNIRFDIPAGLPGGFIPQAFVEVMPSRYQSFLTNNGVADERITAINPAVARLTALDNSDLSEFISRISVRICGEEIPECRDVEEVFYLEFEDIQRQRGDELQLQPTLINAKRLLAQDEFKLEVRFNFLYTTPRTVSTQLDMVFDAVE